MPISIEGKVKITRNLERLKDLPAEALEVAFGYITVIAVRRSKQRLSGLGWVKTGKTLRSIHGEVRGGKAFIRAGGKGAEQATILEYGAKPKPHIIRPNLRKSLYWPGAAHPAKVVRHPGHRIKEGKFLRGPIEEMQNSAELESILTRAVREMQEKMVN